MIGFLEKPLGLDELQAGVAQVFALPRGGAQRAAGEGLAAQLAEVFCEEAPALLAELHAALQRSDAAGVHRVAHTLYGSLRHFDADDASTVADQLQQLGADGEIDGETVRLAESLRVSCERLLASLNGSPGAPGVHSPRRRSE